MLKGSLAYPVVYGNFFLLEILVQRVKRMPPEEIAQRIKDYDPDVCTQVFLSELKRVVPTPEQVRLHSYILLQSLPIMHMINLQC